MRYYYVFVQSLTSLNVFCLDSGMAAIATVGRIPKLRKLRK